MFGGMTSPPTSPAIALDSLTKRYGRLVAVRGVSLTVNEGETFGFLGLNGAGKTTTIRILLDLLRPTSGRAAVFGLDCQARGLAVRDRVGYLPGEMGFYGDMTGQAALDLLGRLGRRHPVDPARRAELVERLAFAPADLHRRIREYSSGMKRKLGIIQAFQGAAPLLVLDEPTEGLDPLMQESFYALLADTRRRGGTVFLSSHVLSEVERVCDRIAVLRKGELALVAPVEEVRSLAPRRVRVHFEHDVDPPQGPLPAGFEMIAAEPRCWTLGKRGPVGEILALLGTLPVRDLEVHEPKLEDVLARYYGGDA
jgi:ABC-2 type transport system ATP-binding protein